MTLKCFLRGASLIPFVLSKPSVGDEVETETRGGGIELLAY